MTTGSGGRNPPFPPVIRALGMTNINKQKIMNALLVAVFKGGRSEEDDG